MTETDVRWAPIPRFPGYQASAAGNIRKVSILGHIKHISASPQRSGHMVVWIRPEDGSPASRQYVHRLVLEAFVGPGDGLYACHHDDNPGNNRLSNLRWGTPQDNADDRKRNSTRIKPSKLQPIDIHADWSPERVALATGRNALAAILTNLDHQRDTLLAELNRLDAQIEVVAGASAIREPFSETPRI